MMTHSQSLLVALACVSLSGCLAQRTDPTSQPPTMLLKSYPVPEQTASRVVSVLNAVLDPEGGNSVGHATRLPGGRVAVVASGQMQTEVATLLAEVTPDAPLVPTNVRIDYWLVEAVPAEQPSVAPELAELMPAAQRILDADGPASLSLATSQSLLTVDGSSSSMQSGGVFYHQRVNLQPGHDSLLADLEVRDRISRSELETRVQLRPGQLLVLGGLSDPEMSETTRYLVVRATVVDG